MLTSYQCQIIAYVTDGAIICRDCGIGRLDEGEADGLKPLIRYEVDEYDSQSSSETIEWGSLLGEHSEYCGCTFGVYCDDCGGEITEPWGDPSCEIGRGVANDPNPPAVRWVPCGQCGAGDGERHRDGCPQIPQQPVPVIEGRGVLSQS